MTGVQTCALPIYNDILFWFIVSHYKQYVTNWETRLTKSDPSCRAEVESSEVMRGPSAVNASYISSELSSGEDDMMGRSGAVFTSAFGIYHHFHST